MALRRSQKNSLDFRNARKRCRENRLRTERRRFLLEQLEERRLLAIGPQLGGIQPNTGELIVDAKVLPAAPSNLTFRFDDQQQIDPGTLDGIRIKRSGGDGSFDDYPATLDFNTNQRVQITFSLVNPTDIIDLEFTSSDHSVTNNDLVTISNVTDSGIERYVIRFNLNRQPGNETTAADLVQGLSDHAGANARIQALISGDGNEIIQPVAPIRGDIPVNVGFVGVNPSPDQNEVILRFAETLTDEHYRIEIDGTGSDALRNTDGFAFKDLTDDNVDNGSDHAPIHFELDLGPQVVAVVPQPVKRQPDGNQELVQERHVIEVYFNNDDLFVQNDDLGNPTRPSAENPNFYQLIYTSESVRSTDDIIFTPTRVEYNTTTDVARLEFLDENGNPRDLDRLVNPSQSEAGVFRLRVGTDEGAPLAPSTLAPVVQVATDFETGDQVIVEFTSVRPGEHGLSIEVTKNNQSVQLDPIVTVADNRISIELNANTATSAFRLVAALNNHPEARQQVVAAIVDGNGAADITPVSDGLQLQFIGLGSSFETATDLSGVSDSGPVLVVTGDGSTFTDGELFTIGDESDQAQFEMDAGSVLQIRADGNGIVDAETISISDGVHSRLTFEFDDTAQPGFMGLNVPVVYSSVDSQQTIVDTLIAAIEAEVISGRLEGFAPVDMGNGRIHLGWNTMVDVLAANVAITDIAGVGTVGALPVQFMPFNRFTVSDVANNLALAVNTSPLDITATTVGNRIEFEGAPTFDLAQIADRVTQTIQSRFDSGSVLQIVGAGVCTGNDLGCFVDGQSFAVTDNQGVTQSFEFDLDGMLNNADAERISFSDTDNEQAMANTIASAINTASFSVQATVSTVQTEREGINVIYLDNDRDVRFSPTLSGILKTSQGIVISSAISPQPFDLDFLGGNDDPGHRQIPGEVGDGIEQHINADFGPDVTPGITTIFYNFKEVYGETSTGSPLMNQITESQKQRAREAFQLWSDQLGVQFLETESEGITIVRGNQEVLDPGLPNVLDFETGSDFDFRVRIDPRLGDSMLIMDLLKQSSGHWNDELNEDWFRNVMTGIGLMLGLDLANDLPRSSLMAFNSPVSQFPNAPTPELIYPGNADVLHGQFLYRPDSIDIDLYKFTIDLPAEKQGILTAESFAQRLTSSSLLDTVLRLYRENPDGTRDLVAQNDDYFSSDSYIELSLGAGTYYIGVSASGNANYDPTIEDTGIGGTSQGTYDLRLQFRSNVDDEASIRDRDGRLTLLDGDADGVPGGFHNFWFKTAPEFTGVETGPRTIFVDKANTTAPHAGTLANPYDNIQSAFAAARYDDIVRIVGNGGADQDRSTLNDNLAYVIGVHPVTNTALEDGATMEVPQGVTVMIEPGAILKLSQARIGVGSSNLTIDRSESALQVLGAPRLLDDEGNLERGADGRAIAGSVYFTSFNDQNTGLTPPNESLPSVNRGDWGGISFRNDIDKAESRPNLEDEGIFLNYVNHADIRFGGGQLFLDSAQQVVSPIQMDESRPTITFNTITGSADSAMSAAPNSF